ncbi:hypothetical protein DY000_02008475 [Brassica cretica]|uniref:HNH nuclease domain-containing protein n=1 Tax=Brassica cretica TaxID=69181 RepID=A0ABQ7BWT7_BRACR|nr:hypothetical protein DY000_02008475 [Brassica cretica]
MDWPTTLISRRICNLLIFFVHKNSSLDLDNQHSAMKHGGKDHHRRRNRGALSSSSSSSSPPKTRPSGSPSRTSGEPRGGKVATSATLLDREETGLFPGSGYDDPDPEPRSFPYSVKQQCWEKAEKIKGRDPERWRRDPLGNIVFRKLVGCPGCLCHDYDHIVPYSKGNGFFSCALMLIYNPGYLGGKDHTSIVDIIHQGGKSTLDNCQVLQAKVNRSKGNKTDISRAELIQRSSYCRVAGRDMDLIELTAYGNAKVNRSKGNKTDISRAELIQRSSYCRVAGRDMDLIELTAYGNVQRAPESSGCRMQ